MSDHTYKCKTAQATADRIWQGDFYFGSFNELVESSDPDVVVATVGLSEVSGVEGRVSMVATLNRHPWGEEIIESLIEKILFSDPPLLEWTIEYKYLSWTVTMVWRD